MNPKNKKIDRLTIIMPYEIRMKIRKLAAQDECSSGEWLRRLIKKELEGTDDTRRKN